jgi:hypothetical protein
VKQLIAEGKLKRIKVASGEHGDRRVRNLVSVRSLNSLVRKRAKKRGRLAAERDERHIDSNRVDDEQTVEKREREEMAA